MQLDPYLFFNGQCEAAFKFYEQCLGGKVEMMQSYGDSPMAGESPPGWEGKVMHARMVIGDKVLMASDDLPGRYKPPQGFAISLAIDDPAEAERVFNALAENGAVRMPLQQTFWAARFGMLVDRFGIPWMVNCD